MSRRTQKEIITTRIKKVKRLQKERDKIYEAQRNLGYIILDKPIRNGWYKIYRLRDDILRKKNARTYQEVLDAIAIPVWGSEKKYADRNWKRHFKNYGFPGIKRLNRKAYDKLSGGAKRYFVPIRKKQYQQYKTKYSCILPRYYFQSSYKRAYLTKIKIISPVLESREQEIEQLLTGPELRKHYYSGWSYNWHYSSHKSNRRKIKMQLGKRWEEEFIL